MSKIKWVEKLKSDKGARAVALTLSVMVLVLTAIIVTTVIANRAASRATPAPADDTPASVTEEPKTDTSAVKDDPAPDPTPVEVISEPADVLPDHFLLPVSGVLIKPHSADVQVFSDTMGDYRVHLGIDIGTVAGACVSAMADGTVAAVWQDVSMGQCVAVRHGGDALTVYKNLSAELPETVVPGAPVKAGDVIGTVGDTAMVEIAEEPHLHLEMTVGGLQVNPVDYLDAAAIATLSEDTNYEDVS